MDKDKVWIWNVNLAWELFSAGIYNYRLSLVESKKHKKHAYYKATIFNMTTAVEAYCNEVLAKAEGWDENKLRCGIQKKLEVLRIDYNKSRFKNSKFIRNELLVHYKGIDYRYFVKIDQAAALEAIESSQEIIAEISFNRKVIFPYWITGLNFINPKTNNDIWLMNDYEFWCRFKWLNTSELINNMISPSGDVYPPRDKDIYNSLYKELWEKLKSCNFRLEVLNRFKSDKFPYMPVLTSEWWMEI